MVDTTLTQSLQNILPGFTITAYIETGSDFIKLRFGSTPHGFSNLKNDSDLWVYLILVRLMPRMETGVDEPFLTRIVVRKDIFYSESLTYWASHLVNSFYRQYISMNKDV